MNLVSKEQVKEEEFDNNDKNTFRLPRQHRGNAVQMRAKRGRTGQIAAIGAVGYYGFTTIGRGKRIDVK